jgi:prepilin-type N-terminal cleavage/methylation domain-containing protein
MRRKQEGFSLIELLIVVAIILIIVAIAIPSFLRSRIAANQASAIESLRLLSTAEVSYTTTYGTGFSTTLQYLGPPSGSDPVSSTAAGLVDSILAGGFKSGYTFVYTATLYNATSNTWNGFNVLANPAAPGQTGGVWYFIDQTGVIRGNSTTTAGSSDIAVAD